MEASNFMLNSGSYFAIQSWLIFYYLVMFCVNKIATYFARSTVARHFGIFAYQSDYWNEFVVASFKLFLETYFDLVICSSINLFAFYKSANREDLMEFFSSRDNVICSTITIVYSFLVVFFPIYVFFYIKAQNGKFDNQRGLL